MTLKVDAPKRKENKSNPQIGKACLKCQSSGKIEVSDCSH